MSIAGEPPVLLFIAGLVLFLGLTGLVMWKHNQRSTGSSTMVVFAIVSAAWYGAEWARQAGLLWMFVPHVQETIRYYGTLLICWAYVGFTLQFLRYDRRSLNVWLAGVLPLIALVIFDSNPLGTFADVIWQNAQQQLLRGNFSWYALEVSCAIYLLLAVVITIHSHNATRQPMHRNRTRYLYAAWLLVAASAALNFAHLPSLAFGVHLFSMPLVAFMTLVHQLPDLRLALRQILSYVIMAALTGVLFALLFLGAGRVFGGYANYNPVLSGAVIALMLALLFHPLLTLIRKLVNRMFHGQDYNPAQVVREYSQSTGNILDLDLLAAVSTGAIREVLGLQKAHLILVEQPEDKDQRGYLLRPILDGEKQMIEPVTLTYTSPLATFFVQEHRLLTQYDIDFLPAFRCVPKEELAWFHRSGMEAYIPIIAHNEWIGLFMVGSKTSGDSYSDADILLLNALANQTATSLENARLVKHLVELNRELQKAYNDLNHANKKLEKLDRVKSDFIQVASHELRTPITLLMGYSDILSGEPAILDNMFLAQTVSGIRTGAARMQEIVAGMLDMAKIDSRSLRLAPKLLSIPAVVRSVQAGMAQTMSNRRLQFEMVETNTLPPVEADVDALHKVFYHLLSNAVKFTPNGGRICVIQKMIPAEQSPLSTDSIEVVVSDTGIGVEPEIQELVFSKFYQTGDVNLHSTSKTRYKGSGPGLGLAIVRGIVEAHGGKVWLISPGYDEETCPGSEFHVLLPLSQNAQGEVDAQPA